MSDMVTDTQSAIAAIGGISEVARALGHRHASTVQGWNERNRVPAHQVMRFVDLARERGLSVNIADIIMPPYHSASPAVSRQDAEKPATKVAGAKACSAPPEPTATPAAGDPIILCALCERPLTSARRAACQYLDCPAKERE